MYGFSIVFFFFFGDSRWRFCNKGLFHIDRVMIKSQFIMLMIWRLEKRFKIKIWCSSLIFSLCGSLKLLSFIFPFCNLGHIWLNIHFINILCIYIKQKMPAIIILVVVLHFIPPTNKPHLVSSPRSFKSS